MSKVSVIPDQFAVFAVDPGGTSGWSWALLSNRTSLRQTLRRCARKRAWRAGETAGAWDDQVYELLELYLDFRLTAHVEMGIATDDVHLVIEQFELRQRNVELSPLQIGSGLHVMTRVWGVDYQQPSQAMSFATSERLHDWGVWTVGSEHARDATRHLALKAAKILKGTIE